MEERPKDTSHEQIQAHSPEWAASYEAEAAKLKKVFGDALLGIEHIGSTSVEGLASKPIVDIMVLVADHADADKYIPELEKLGYAFDAALHAKTQFPERHFFRKGMPTEFHLSIAYANKGSFWKRQLAFRDYLREHPEERDKYVALKQNLIQQFPEGKEGYIEGKTEFVNEMLDKSGFVRWKPSDA